MCCKGIIISGPYSGMTETSDSKFKTTTFMSYLNVPMEKMETMQSWVGIFNRVMRTRRNSGHNRNEK